MKRSIWGFAVLVGLLGLGRPGFAATYNVIPSGPSNCGGGTCNLQAALDAAALSGGDDVLQLAAGTYSASLGTFHYNPVIDAGALTLEGDPGGGTIFEGSGNQIMTVDTTGAIADGASVLLFRNISFQNGITSDFGAALSVMAMNADTQVEGCHFFSNTSSASGTSAGGGALAVIVDGNGSIELRDSEFQKNSTGSAGGAALIVAEGTGDISLSGNAFVENSALDPGFGNSGAVFALSEFGNVSFDRNSFLRNRATIAGGGFLSEVLIGIGTYTNNIIAGNEILSSGNNSSMPFLGAGALFVAVAGTVNVVNNTVIGNTMVNGDGGGLAIATVGFPAVANVYNNIVFGNRSSGGLLCPVGCDDILVLDNGGVLSAASNDGGIINAAHNDYGEISYQCDPNAGCTPHRNIDPSTDLHFDPLFVNAGLDDFHLSAGSPVIDKGDSHPPFLPPLDFDEAPRVQGSAPDMGALEFDPTASGVPEDCDNNIDDDGDNKIDCLDPDCSGDAACGGGGSTGGAENCSNQADDDGDGKVDCDDSNCVGAVACRGSQPSEDGDENCANNVDDDGDGNIDCNDPDCAGVCNADSQGSNGSITVQSCALHPGAVASPWSALWLAPTLLVGLRRRRKS